MTDPSAARNQALLDWYRANRRPLPWRQTPTPWFVLVSEVMAQQTQIERVAERFATFVAAYPSPASLAAAPRAEVLRAWSGLGYNRRAVHLHEAARAIERDGWPSTIDGLLELPGVGPYTAAAVACFAFGHPVATVDTNLRRVLQRWHGSQLTPRELREVAGRELDRGHPAEWNQAIMDLAAHHCRAPTPTCVSCPVETWCSGPATYRPPRSQGRWEGSSRQARGAVVRHLVDVGSGTIAEIAAGTAIAPPRVAAALDALTAEGLAVFDGSRARLPG